MPLDILQGHSMPRDRDATRWRAFNDWLKRMMEQRHITSYRQLAMYAGVTPTTIMNSIRGLHQPSEGTVRKIASYFRVEPDFLLRLAGYYVPLPANTASRIDDPELDLAFRELTETLTPEELEPVKAYLQFVLERRRKRDAERKAPRKEQDG